MTSQHKSADPAPASLNSDDQIIEDGPATNNTTIIIANKQNHNVLQRSRSGILMLGAFILILLAGQTYSAILVLFIIYMGFKEVSSLKRNYQKQKDTPIAQYINWSIYLIINYYALGDIVLTKFGILIVQYPMTIGVLCKYHNFITVALSMLVILVFVCTLKAKYMRYQFKLFAWIFTANIFTMFPSFFIMKNCFQGIFWLIIPAILINVNDTFAYFFGYFFGKNQLIAISPKKTWEGYIAGVTSTIIFSYILIIAIQDIPGITCSLSRPTLKPFYFDQCVEKLRENSQIIPSISKITFHTMIIGLFVSVVGPFGGFFASGLKRSLKIKDFSNLIPGHGGIIDRMDSQILIGFFTYFYINYFVRIDEKSPMLATWISTMTLQQKISMYTQLSASVNSQITDLIV